MIVPMKKISLVVMDKHREDALKKLRDIGVIHLDRKDVSSETLVKLFGRKEELGSALEILSSREAEAKAAAKAARKNPAGETAAMKRSSDFYNAEGVPFSIEALDSPNRKRDDLILHILNLEEKQKFLRERKNILAWERGRAESWGFFNPEDIQFLKNHGIALCLYEMAAKDLEAMPANIPYIITGRNNSVVCVATLDREIPGKAPFEVGEYSITEMDSLLEDIQGQLANINGQLVSLVQRKHVIENELKNIHQQIEFETARAGMGLLGEAPAGSAVSWISGYVPQEDLGLLKRASAENSWALIADDPKKEDTPPTKLKGNSFVRIIHPVLAFLGTIPGYREFDISPSYLVFFSIFFAMILGDAGYGMLLLVTGIVAGLLMKKKGGAVPDPIKLLMLLTSCTVFWGAITGAWFQIPQAHLPGFLAALIIPPFNGTGPVVEFPLFLQTVFKLPAVVPVDDLKTRWNIQFLCFSIAVVQLVWARGKRVLSLLPSLLAIAQFGILIMMLGFYFLVLNMLLGIELPAFVIPLIATGFILNVLFSEQNGGNFFLNIAKGLGNFISIFLKAVGCFADIISYIRLFAVGLAGAMIAQIFNSMAVPAEGLGSFGLAFLLKLVPAVLILAVGHSLNLALTALSVIVHGVRLNLLEYAGNHLEMEWSGYSYNPFALKQKKEETK